jgi:hypothetical protein
MPRLSAQPTNHSRTVRSASVQANRMLGDIGVEIVHQHPKSCLLLPTLAGDFGSARSTDWTWTGDHCHQ